MILLKDIMGESKLSSYACSAGDGPIMEYCPFASERHGSGKSNSRSFAMYFSTDSYHCFACKASGRISGDFTIQQPKRKYVPPNPELPLSIYYENTLDINDSEEAAGYVHQRGLTEKSITALHLRLSSRRDGIVFPCLSRTSLKYQWRQTRLINPKGKAKVLTSKDVKKHLDLMGQHLLKDKARVIVVEGLFGLANAVERAPEGFCTVALCCSVLSQEQAHIIASTKPKEVILLLDNDKAGIEASRKAYALLKDNFWIPKITNITPDCDVDFFDYSSL
jgi:DNA primase